MSPFQQAGRGHLLPNVICFTALDYLKMTLSDALPENSLFCLPHKARGSFINHKKGASKKASVHSFSPSQCASFYCVSHTGCA